MQTAWFRERLADRELSQRGLAKLLGLDPAAVSLLLRGQRRMTPAEAKRLADVLGAPVTEILRRAGVAVHDDVQRVPVTGYADAEGTVTLFPNKTHDTAIGPADCPAGTHGIQVRSPGMPQDGWLLFCSPAEHEPAQHLDQLCTAALDTGQQVISTIRRGYRNGTHNLVCYPSMTIRHDCHVVWAAPVLWIKPA